MRGLKQKRVLVTGGASGIGEATVRRFLEEGSRVAVIDRDAEGCERLRSEHADLAAAVVADVSSHEAVARAFAELDGVFEGGLDVLVNNAGISIRRSFLETTREEWAQVLDTNLSGVFFVAREAAERMRAGGGVIVNMGSMNGLIGCPNYASYNAAKAGVIELTRTMALELAPAIRVLGVCPGAVLTPMQEAEYTQEMFDGLNARIPLRRHAKPEEIAALFAFLASDEAPFIAGHSVVIDGGESAGGLASQADENL